MASTNMYINENYRLEYITDIFEESKQIFDILFNVDKEEAFFYPEFGMMLEDYILNHQPQDSIEFIKKTINEFAPHIEISKDTSITLNMTLGKWVLDLRYKVSGQSFALNYVI